MSKIKNAFKNGKAFIGYLTGGDPSIEKCEEFVLEMVKAGADLIEIGIPFPTLLPRTHKPKFQYPCPFSRNYNG